MHNRGAVVRWCEMNITSVVHNASIASQTGGTEATHKDDCGWRDTHLKGEGVRVEQKRIIEGRRECTVDRGGAQTHTHTYTHTNTHTHAQHYKNAAFQHIHINIETNVTCTIT